MKYIYRIGFAACFFMLLLQSCNSGAGNEYQQLQGEVFGTYYRFQIDSEKDFSRELDSVFKAIDDAINTYREDSEISKFNRTGIAEDPSPTFLETMQLAQKFYTETDGYFAPSVVPGDEARETNPDSGASRTEFERMSFLKAVQIDSSGIKALREDVRVDLNAMGEGYAIDAVTSILDRYGVTNYMIEIGGEMKCRGVNTEGNVWLIGIERPETETGASERSLMNSVSLNNKALSTSGSYRKFYVDSLGGRHAHIIDPMTGASVTHNLLSVSVKTESATVADAFATACMAMGTERAKEFLREKEVEGFFIYAEEEGFQTWNTERFFDE